MIKVTIAISEESLKLVQEMLIPNEVISVKHDFTKYDEWVEQKKIATEAYKKLKSIELKIAGQWEI